MAESVLFEFLETSVEELHTPNAFSIMESRTVKEAVELMKENHEGYLLVIDKNIDLKGILTERDVMMKAFGNEAILNGPVSDIMTKNPVTIGGNESIAVALQQMNHKEFHHLPVVDMAGKPIGIISITDVMNFLIEEIESDELVVA